jgi:hypothetical protein
MSELRQRKFMHLTEPAKSFTPIARSAGPMERIIPENVNIAYEGTRVNKKGETVSAFLAENAIKSLYNGMQLPIFEDYPGIPMEEGYNNLASKFKGEEQGLIINDNDPNLWFLIVETKGTQKPIVRQNIIEAANSPDITDRPIVMLVTSGMPHAILYIFQGANLYTCGYGYSREIGHNYTNLTSNLLIKAGQSDIAHTFEKMTGSIFTADAMVPSETHQAKISWVGFLDMEMVRRIQDFLNNTSIIIFSGKKEGRYNKVSNNAKLIVSNAYYAAAGILPSRESYNCLTWAQNILGVNVDCGILGNPRGCKGITQEQFTLLRENMNNANFPQIISDIQKTLEAPSNICTRIGKAMGICGGSRRRSKRNKKNKRKSRKSRKSKR